MKKLASVIEEVIGGVTEQRFYSIFAQCLVCKVVMFREDFAANHAAACIHNKANKYHPYRRSRPVARAPRLNLGVLPADRPEHPLLRSPSTPSPNVGSHGTGTGSGLIDSEPEEYINTEVEDGAEDDQAIEPDDSQSEALSDSSLPALSTLLTQA